MVSLVRVTAVLVLFCAVSAQAFGEWATQRIALQPGWNAIYLEVLPDDNSCQAVFGHLPVHSVWAWNKRFTSVQFISDPSELLPEQPEWLTWFPEHLPEHIVTDLFAVHAGSAYLVRLGGTSPAELVISGKPQVSKTRWFPNSYNLVGFHVDPANPPSFQTYFAPASALNGQPMYRMDAEGKWRRITSPSTERLRSGEAYWVYCQGTSSFSGPLSLELRADRELKFGESLTEQMLGLRNDSSAPRTVTIRHLPAQGIGKSTGLAGEVALSYKQIISWEPLTEPLTVTLAPRQAAGVNLAVRRADMESVNGGAAEYGSLLEISDGSGTLYYLAVSASKNATPAGLWVGEVTVNKVSEAGNPQTPTVPTPTGSEFSFRIIVHVDKDGVANLLQEVFLMQVKVNPPPPGFGVKAGEIDFRNFLDATPARYVLLTDINLVDQYDGVMLRDGELVGRRISTPVFAFPDPQPMNGSINTNLRLRNPIVLDYNSSLNPFVHRFHPDHDNLDERYEQTRPPGRESFNIVRNITLEFTQQDPERLGLPNWGYDLIGGTYKETISGVHKRTIHVEGRFRLNKVSDVDVLNDGQ